MEMQILRMMYDEQMVLQSVALTDSRKTMNFWKTLYAVGSLEHHGMRMMRHRCRKIPCHPQ
jgi:hypothetical protein